MPPYRVAISKAFREASAFLRICRFQGWCLPIGGIGRFMKEKQLEALRAEFSSGDKSSPLMISTLSEWYDAKHRKVSCEEIAYINSLAITSCPYCGSPAIRRDGFKKSGLRCYECSSCGRKFSPVTNTIFDSRKIPFSEWIEYLSHLFFRMSFCVDKNPVEERKRQYFIG